MLPARSGVAGIHESLSKMLHEFCYFWKAVLENVFCILIILLFFIFCIKTTSELMLGLG